MSPIITCILLLLLCMAAYQDICSYRIGNMLVISGAILGVLLNVFLPTGISLYQSLAGWGVGLLLLLPLYLLRAMGAGDVKLMAMVGAFMGPQAIMVTLLYVLVAGGVLSVCFAMYRGVFKKLFTSTRIILSEFMNKQFTPKSKHLPKASSFTGITQDETAKMPYGLAIAVGTVIFLAVNQPSIL